MKVIGHRGAAGLVPENFIAGFDLDLFSGVSGARHHALALAAVGAAISTMLADLYALARMLRIALAAANGTRVGKREVSGSSTFTKVSRSVEYGG